MKLRHKAEHEALRADERQRADAPADAKAGGGAAPRAKGAEDFDLAAAATTRTGADKEYDLSTVPPHAGPDRPSQLRFRGLFAAVRRTFKQYSTDNVSDWAAALTYYGVLSIFPGALVLVSLLGMLNRNGQRTVTDTVQQITDNKQIENLVGTVLNQVKDPGTAGFAAVVGLALAFWSASGYVGAFMRASNAVYDVPEGRPPCRRRATRWPRLGQRDAGGVGAGALRPAADRRRRRGGADPARGEPEHLGRAGRARVARGLRGRAAPAPATLEHHASTVGSGVRVSTHRNRLILDG